MESYTNNTAVFHKRNSTILPYKSLER